MRQECQERFPATDFKGSWQLAIPAYITARAWRTSRDAFYVPASGPCNTDSLHYYNHVTVGVGFFITLPNTHDLPNKYYLQ